jgi:hypothetical protein
MAEEKATKVKMNERRTGGMKMATLKEQEGVEGRKNKQDEATRGGYEGVGVSSKPSFRGAVSTAVELVWSETFSSGAVDQSDKRTARLLQAYTRLGGGEGM